MQNNTNNNGFSPSENQFRLGSDPKGSGRNHDTFNFRLKKRREKLGLKQEELGKKVGVSTTSIQNWEADTWPRGDYIVALVKALDCSLEWLLLGEGDPEIKQPQPGPSKPIEIEILRQVIEGVEDGLNELESELDPEKKAELIILLYEYYAETEKDIEKKTVAKYLRLVS